jgi:GGDEF domain-containing protein
LVGAVLFAARASTRQVAERLHARVDGLRLEGDGFGYAHLTVTIGVAHVDASSGDIAAVLRRADQAMYAATAFGGPESPGIGAHGRR